MVNPIRAALSEVDFVETGEDAGTMLIAAFAGAQAGEAAQGDPSILGVAAFVIPSYFVLVFVIGISKAVLLGEIRKQDRVIVETLRDLGVLNDPESKKAEYLEEWRSWVEEGNPGLPESY